MAKERFGIRILSLESSYVKSVFIERKNNKKRSVKYNKKV